MAAVEGRRTFRTLFRLEKEKNWIPDNRQSDVRCVADLILADDNGKLGELSGGLAADFKEGTNTVFVKHADGSLVKVVVRMTEAVEPLFTPPRSTFG